MKNKQKIKVFSLCLTLLAVIVTSASADSVKSTSTAAASGDTLRNVWVFFKDKGRSAPPVKQVSARAALRRGKAGFRDIESDRPVNGGYIREVERLGGTLRTAFHWGNAASFSVNPSRIAAISSLPFVKAVSPVGIYINKKIDDRGAAGGLSKTKSKFVNADSSGYDWHTEMVGVPLAHDYLRYKGRRRVPARSRGLQASAGEVAGGRRVRLCRRRHACGRSGFGGQQSAQSVL